MLVMGNAYDLFEKGKGSLERQNFLKAIMALEQAKEREPEKGSIREALAIAYYNHGFYLSAHKNFKKALDIDITNDYAHYGLGLCLVKRGELKRALGHLKMALAMKPDSKIYKEELNKFI
jgi:tetratricopeptide (TPR) repeat protein